MEIEEFYNEFISRFNGYKRFFSSDDCKNKLAKKNDMKEFLIMDYTVFRTTEVITLDNLAIQDVIYAIEHENKVAYNSIAYSILKLLNVSAENKIMIGYVRKARKEEKEEEKKEEIFEKLDSQIQKMEPNRFRADEKLLVILGHNGMKNSSHYTAKLFHLKSKEVIDL